MTYSPLHSWPKISRRAEDIKYLDGPLLGVDAEWELKENQPTILGLSDGERTVCVPWKAGEEGFRELVTRFKGEFVLHNGISADLPVFSEHGIHIPLERVQDTILWHWLTSPNLCKTKKKSNDDESLRRGAGFLNLYSMCSLYTDAPNWKECRGETCNGPCPEHDVFGYCGNDALWPVVALSPLQKVAAFRGVAKLYPLHRSLANVLAKMTSRGVLIDTNHVESLRADLGAAKQAIRLRLSFNPESPSQILKKFPALSDTTEESIRDLVTESSEPELQLLLDYKELGDGPDRWFAPRVWSGRRWKGYVDENSYAHPRFNCFTSSGRLASAGPNFQNIARRRLDRTTGEDLGARIRKAIIAPEGSHLVEADYKNAENRVILWLAGYQEIPEMDFHSWMVELIGIKPTDPFALALGGPRDAAKSVTHATNYMEGLQLKTMWELRKPSIQREISNGARIVFEDWKFLDKLVTFTGSNLARRAFGDATYENRKRALDIQTRYFQAFPKIRDLQKRITREVERERMVKPPSGLFVPSYGQPEDRLKTAMAIYGSQPVAHLTKLALVASERQTELVPWLQCHDALSFYVDRAIPLDKTRRLCEDLMVFECDEMPGLKIPVDVKVGLNWGEMRKI